MKVALSISTDPERGYDFVRHQYVPYLMSIGLLPIVIPNHLGDVRAYVAALDVEGLVLTGGGDIAPERYGQPNTASNELAPTRDQTESVLLDWATEQNRPVLGICRGVQMINVYFGGGLVQDILTELGSRVHGKGNDAHDIQICDPRFADVIGADGLRVNTYHHQGISRDGLAPALNVFAVSPADGVVEGVFHREKPVIGVQWHPERPTPSTEADARRFRRFFEGGAWW
ncbi:MAG: hypothetical protein EHM39_09265 [Chloroflexi bacterium]|nr:MAG: hypothetical protein EHM39_09265 [Chloroflexota bacterium]